MLHQNLIIMDYFLLQSTNKFSVDPAFNPEAVGQQVI